MRRRSRARASGCAASSASARESLQPAPRALEGSSHYNPHSAPPRSPPPRNPARTAGHPPTSGSRLGAWQRPGPATHTRPASAPWTPPTAPAPGRRQSGAAAAAPAEGPPQSPPAARPPPAEGRRGPLRRRRRYCCCCYCRLRCWPAPAGRGSSGLPAPASSSCLQGRSQTPQAREAAARLPEGIRGGSGNTSDQ